MSSICAANVKRIIKYNTPNHVFWCPDLCPKYAICFISQLHNRRVLDIKAICQIHGGFDWNVEQNEDEVENGEITFYRSITFSVITCCKAFKACSR